MRQKGIVYAKQYSSTCISLCVCLYVCLSICVFVPLCLSICHSLARALSHALALSRSSLMFLSHAPTTSLSRSSLSASICLRLSVYLSVCLSAVRTRARSQLTSFTQSDYLRSLPQATVRGKLKDNQTRARQIPEPSRLPRSICFHLSGG